MYFASSFFGQKTLAGLIPAQENERLGCFSCPCLCTLTASFAGKQDELFNRRVQLNLIIIGQQKGSDSKKTFKEKFVPPELSMITFFMTKPFVEVTETEFFYDSDDSLSSDEEYDSDDEELEDDVYETDLNRPNTL